MLQWGFKQAGAVVGLVFGILALRLIPREVPDQAPDFLERIVETGMFWRWEGLQWLMLLELIAIAFFLVQLPVSYLLTVLEYRYRWYMVTAAACASGRGCGRSRSGP